MSGRLVQRHCNFVNASPQPRCGNDHVTHHVHGGQTSTSFEKRKESAADCSSDDACLTDNLNHNLHVDTTTPRRRGRDDSYVYPVTIALGCLDSLQILYHIHHELIGGNQREMDRQKAQKKLQANAKKPKESAQSLQARKERDAAALREKQKVSNLRGVLPGGEQ
ncbi:hypothetical protein GY45DRAFT_1326930 [Cubamyces sp. BRFM 1775]|nr:hypothetical protein GY45DRAFT_1326930 [Cubamyces sp. BRFM 1775]